MKQILFILFLPLSALAFGNTECGDLFPKIADKHQPYLGPVYSTTMVPSTSSYLSSTGKCSMYGSLMQTERAQFVAGSYNEISADAAKGSGEYLNTLAKLSGCKDSTQNEFAGLLQKHHASIFSKANSDSSFKVLRSLDLKIRDTNPLNTSCNLALVQ